MSTAVTMITNDSKLDRTYSRDVGTGETASQNRGRILVVDTDQAFRESLAQAVTAAGYTVLTAATGRQAFSLLRDRRNPIDWLYTRAVLDSLIDGRVLADEYYSTHPERSAVIATSGAETSASRDIILRDPKPSSVADAIRNMTGAKRPAVLTNPSKRADAA